MICKHNWIKFEEPIKDDEFVQCTRCGVIKTVKKHWINICKSWTYGRNYYEKEELWTIINGIPMNMHYIEIHLPYFEKFGLAGIHPSKNLCYVGCGIGQFISYFLKNQWSIDCIEISHWAARYLKSAYYGINVLFGDFETMDINNKYDAVICCHTLEHFRNADLALEKMINILKPSGILYVEIPNGVRDIYVHDHFWHFSPESIKYWFEHSGLKDIQIEYSYSKDERAIECIHCKGVK